MLWFGLSTPVPELIRAFLKTLVTRFDDLLVVSSLGNVQRCCASPSGFRWICDDVIVGCCESERRLSIVRKQMSYGGRTFPFFPKNIFYS
jgi:hypothetical protein